MAQDPKKAVEKAVNTAVEATTQTINDGQVATLKILTGDYKHENEPRPLVLSGNIDTVKRFLLQRGELFDHKKANIIVDQDAFEIALAVEEEDVYKKQISGSLKVSTELNKMRVNDGRYYTTADLAKFFKMNRSQFANRAENMALVTELNNFRAKINKEVEKIDSPTQKRSLQDSIVNSNLPPTFTLLVPLFKGFQKVEIECEFYFNTEDLTATIVSAEAVEKMDIITEEIIGKEIEEIEQIAPGLLITYK